MNVVYLQLSRKKWGSDKYQKPKLSDCIACLHFSEGRTGKNKSSFAILYFLFSCSFCLTSSETQNSEKVAMFCVSQLFLEAS